MKQILTLTLSALVLLGSLWGVQAVAEEKPIQHRIVPDITDYAEARQVFAETTSEIKTKTKLDAGELHDIHMITYSLEKALAYFADNLEGDRQSSAAKIADVVELIHLGSENNRAAETKVYLDAYFELAQEFYQTL